MLCLKLLRSLIHFSFFIFTVNRDLRNRLHSPFCGRILVILLFANYSTKSVLWFYCNTVAWQYCVRSDRFIVVVRCIRAVSGFRYNGFAIPNNKFSLLLVCDLTSSGFRLKTSIDMFEVIFSIFDLKVDKVLP